MLINKGKNRPVDNREKIDLLINKLPSRLTTTLGFVEVFMSFLQVKEVYANRI